MLAYASLYRYTFTCWELLAADLENVKQLIVRDLHVSVQNPRPFSLSTVSYSLDGLEQSPVCESIIVREAIDQAMLHPQRI